MQWHGNHGDQLVLSMASLWMHVVLNPLQVYITPVKHACALQWCHSLLVQHMTLKLAEQSIVSAVQEASVHGFQFLQCPFFFFFFSWSQRADPGNIIQPAASLGLIWRHALLKLMLLLTWPTASSTHHHIILPFVTTGVSVFFFPAYIFVCIFLVCVGVRIDWCQKESSLSFGEITETGWD